jgi:hypothetical protein
MITYINTVFVSNNATADLLTAANLNSINASNVATYKGRFIIQNADSGAIVTSATACKRFKIGMITGGLVKDHKGVSHPVIKWSNIIQAADIKSLSTLAYPGADTEDAVTIDFSNIGANILSLLAEGGKRVIVRLTFKDMPHRYRKWTESYEYVTAYGDTAATIAAGIANVINKQWKRARVNVTVGSINTTSTSGTAMNDGTHYFHADANQASTTGAVIRIEALPYDDDDAVETLNWAEKVRFNANIYFTDPAGEGWESLNKHFPTGVTIEKTPGFRYAASAKLVRDREAQGMGYEGILNRGNGTWPIIKPAMETNLAGHYNAVTLEFENMYRAADDIFRKTKQTVEIYMTAATSGLYTVLNACVGGADRSVVDTTTEDGAADE